MYELQPEILGEGQDGRVQKCMNKYTGDIFAVKIVDKLFFDCEVEIERFNMKVDVMKTIKHPNVVKVIESFENKSNIYIVFELFSGIEFLEEISKRGMFSEADAVNVIT